MGVGTEGFYSGDTVGKEVLIPVSATPQTAELQGCA